MQERAYQSDCKYLYTGEKERQLNEMPRPFRVLSSENRSPLNYQGIMSEIDQSLKKHGRSGQNEANNHIQILS